MKPVVKSILMIEQTFMWSSSSQSKPRLGVLIKSKSAQKHHWLFTMFINEINNNTMNKKLIGKRKFCTPMELQLGQSKGGYRNVIRQQIECLRKISNGSIPKYWKYTIFHMIKLKVFPIYSSSITSASAKECLMWFKY